MKWGREEGGSATAREPLHPGHHSSMHDLLIYLTGGAHLSHQVALDATVVSILPGFLAVDQVGDSYLRRQGAEAAFLC
jgi:hypothetical protein